MKADQGDPILRKDRRTLSTNVVSHLQWLGRRSSEYAQSIRITINRRAQECNRELSSCRRRPSMVGTRTDNFSNFKFCQLQIFVPLCAGICQSDYPVPIRDAGTCACASFCFRGKAKFEERWLRKVTKHLKQSPKCVQANINQQFTVLFRTKRQTLGAPGCLGGSGHIKSVGNQNQKSSNKATRSPASYCLNNDVSVWVDPALFKSNGRREQKPTNIIRTVNLALNDHRFKRPPAFSDRFFMHGESAIQTALC